MVRFAFNLHTKVKINNDCSEEISGNKVRWIKYG